MPKLDFPSAALRRIATLATQIAHEKCCYVHSEEKFRDGSIDWRCDCKYMYDPKSRKRMGRKGENPEQTGCCEAREIHDLAKRLLREIQ